MKKNEFITEMNFVRKIVQLLAEGNYPMEYFELLHLGSEWAPALRIDSGRCVYFSHEDKLYQSRGLAMKKQGYLWSTAERMEDYLQAGLSHQEAYEAAISC